VTPALCGGANHHPGGSRNLIRQQGRGEKTAQMFAVLPGIGKSKALAQHSSRDCLEHNHIAEPKLHA